MRILEIMQPKIGKIFIDMDGVICGCNQATADWNNVSVEEFLSKGWGNPYWDKLAKEADMVPFFANMPWEENGEKLLNWFKEHKVPYTFLTRPVKPPKDQDCIEGKKQWLQAQGLTSPVIFERDKEKYAVSNGKPNILIDDHPGNIEKWNAAGGIGIRYFPKQCDEVLEQLEDLLQKA